MRCHRRDGPATVRLVTGLVAICLGVAAERADAQAIDDEASLPEVSVRQVGQRGGMREAVHNVTVITAQDIAKSDAASVTELLTVLGNLSLQSYTGNDKKSTLDMRGMGATAVSNVLIVVDGVAINENDESGADLSTLALSQIERVEIVRGGGGVEHGSGAVAGVVRITTLPSLDEGEMVGGLRARVNDDGDRGWDLHVKRRFGAASAAFQLDRVLANGHRENADLDKTLAAMTLRWQDRIGLSPVDAYLKLTHHRDRYGLPGPVSLEAFEGSDADRWASRTPLNGGRTELDRQDLGASVDFGGLGRTQWRSSHRDRRNPYWLGVDASRPLSEQGGEVIAGQWDHQLSHRIETDALGLKQEVTLGLARMSGEYRRMDGGWSYPGGTLIQGQASSQAGFLFAKLRPADTVTVQAGARANRFRTNRAVQTFGQACSYQDVTLPGIGVIPVQTCGPYSYQTSDPRIERSWYNRATELGVSWQLTPDLSGFVSHNRTFRAPNLDELALATSTLRPQHGQTRELGIRHRVSNALNWSATLFDIRIEDEIYYGKEADADRALNRNLEVQTRRLGAELSVSWQPLASIQFQGQLTHLKPQLEGSSFDIPLVARTTASLVSSWQSSDAWRWSIAGRFVGPRRDGSIEADGSSPWRRLRSYDVWDASVRYTHGHLNLTFGVRNLFDEVYSPQAYSQGYYPMPGRQAHAELAWGF